MSKVGLTLLRPDWQSPLSPHFGIATWLLIYDTEMDQKKFERNRLLMGKGVVDVFALHRCTDAVFSNIGPGALEILRAAGIRAWYGPPDIPASQLVDRLKQGELEPANEARSHDHESSSGHSRGKKLRDCCRQGGKRGGSARDQNLSTLGRSRGRTASGVRNCRRGKGQIPEAPDGC
jgi:predicted Fe-Mo cluster-binding NifX family protein